MKMTERPDKQTVLYLSYDGLTDALGQSQILPYLCGLADSGYVITIISFEKWEIFLKHQSDIEKTCREHNLEWRPMTYHKFPPILSTVYDLWMLRYSVKKLLLSRKIEIVHCRSYITSLVGVWAKKRFGLKFVFDMRGFWADERIDGGLWHLRNPITRLMYNFFKRKEKQFLRQADHIVSLTENGMAEIRSWQCTNAPISVIPTCVDMRLFNPERIASETRSLLDTLSISPDEFVLVYLGSWGTWYMTDDILNFFSVLLSRRPNSRMLILTPDQPDLRTYNFGTRLIVRRVTRSEVPVYLNVAHALICFIKPAYSKKASSATKIAEAWAMNLPVVTNPGWGDIEKLNASGMPLLLCDAKSDIENVVTELIRWEKKDARARLIGTFDLDSGIQKYTSIYRSLSRV